jgi:pilus assembly protein CpaE
MQIFFFNASVDLSQSNDLERRIRAKLPDVQRISRMEEVTKALPKTAGGEGTLACILFPVVLNAPGSFDRMVSIATEYRDSLFFIFISDDIPASDYKRLVQTGGADWASTRGAPEEIAEILARIGKDGVADKAEPPVTEPVMVAFVPSAGGVGNSTLAIEVGIQIKTAKRTRNRRVCLLDLDFQNSHVCDYLDIEPRMQIGEIAKNPERLDAHLFELFISHHSSSGLDVLAAPRNKSMSPDIQLEVLEGLFRMIAARYDLILLDLPVPWFDWTRQLLSAAEVAFVSGLNTIPGLRQVAETLEEIRGVARVPPKMAVVLNRCERRIVGGFARRNHVKNLLGDQEVFFVRADAEGAAQSVNTGIPMAIQDHSKASKGIIPIAQIAAEAKPVPVAHPRS